MKKIIFTKQGFDNLKKKAADLINQRPLAVLDLKKAREMGDLSENGYYKAAKSKLIETDRTIRRNSYLIKNAFVGIPKGNNIVDIGSRVYVEVDGEQKEYVLVGEYEADPGLGKISHLSPVGSRLMGKKVSDEVIVSVVDRKKVYKIIQITS
jgi:transcription elongation factor GreA